MARIARKPYPMPEFNYSGNWRESAHEKEFERLMQQSRDLPEGEIVGTIMKFPRGDGYALYLVTNDHPLTLQWVPYGDAWRVEDYVIRGIRREDVEDQQARDRFWRTPPIQTVRS